MAIRWPQAKTAISSSPSLWFFTTSMLTIETNRFGASLPGTRANVCAAVSEREETVPPHPNMLYERRTAGIPQFFSVLWGGRRNLTDYTKASLGLLRFAKDNRLGENDAVHNFVDSITNLNVGVNL